ncbi:hypothetical protein NLG97_g5013 [Lecanicillium saksenae]|uniref:Uncharacterized protein n=1 Tax=Lecanicillium saksenae TaxID=468837 RepID=A0ACC1QTP6_9HYPO|nr:hypothetical protein NLG97_g5013 [Lecanicillium saksenae]
MSHRYSSSTNASRVAEGISSRAGLVAKTPITERAFSDTQSQRTFFGAFSVHSGKTSRIAKRLSSRMSEPSTFYREATPPGSSQGEPAAQPEETYDPRYDYIAPPAPIPAATKQGLSRRKLCILLSVAIIVIIIVVAVPVGVIFGKRNSNHKSTDGSSTDATSTTSSTPSATSTSTTSTAPVSTSIMPCPAANNTRYLVPDTDKTFKRFCGIDYSGVDQARDLGSVWTTTMQECMFQCADFPGCTACGWGIIADDPGSEHRCWLKTDLKSSHGARAGMSLDDARKWKLYAGRQEGLIFIRRPSGLEKLLLAHLPTSLTLLRKVQYLRRKTTAAAKFPQILFVSNAASIGDGEETLSSPSSFTVAYINTTIAQSTSMYLYSTLQNYEAEPGSCAVVETERQLEVILQKLIKLRKEMEQDMKIELPPSVVLGSLHSRMRGLWEKSGRISPRPTGLYDKWIFDVARVPQLDESLPEGMVWGTGTLEDCRVVASRTDIPRPPEYLVQMPCLFIKLEDGTPVAWAFLDTVGSLISVHCEEPYRNRGLAKKISSKVLRDKVDWFGPGGLSSADVAPDNSASRAMCKSLNGYPTCIVSWVMLDLRDSVSPP